MITSIPKSSTDGQLNMWTMTHPTDDLLTARFNRIKTPSALELKMTCIILTLLPIVIVYLLSSGQQVPIMFYIAVWLVFATLYTIVYLLGNKDIKVQELIINRKTNLVQVTGLIRTKQINKQYPINHVKDVLYNGSKTYLISTARYQQAPKIAITFGNLNPPAFLAGVEVAAPDIVIYLTSLGVHYDKHQELLEWIREMLEPA